MNRYLAAVLILSAPAGAAAQTIDPTPGRLEIVGQAPSACLIRTPTGEAAVNATFESTGSSSGQIRITEFVDPGSAQSRGASMDLVVPVICNSPHRVTVRSGNGGLRRLGSPVPAGPFIEFLPYQVNAVWGGSQGGIASDSGGPLLIDSPSARAGQLSLSFDIARGGRPLVAGTYSDSIVIELQAAN
ncbi:MAG TPA: hypothetical protein VFO69_07345 [Allosphingosinicella sp.]|nr:hypothetical protein [Allosphingosinicella sp.]